MYIWKIKSLTMKSSMKIAQLSLVFLFSFFIMSLTAPTVREKIVGKWVLTKAPGKSKNKINKRQEYILFESDGRMFSVRGGDVENARFIGKWDVDEESMTLFIQERSDSEEEMQIVKITETKMILSERKGKEIHFKKVR